MLWDSGSYEADADDVATALRAGELRFTLNGKKLKGAWVLVRTGGRKWLLMKRMDAAASKTVDMVTEKPFGHDAATPRRHRPRRRGRCRQGRDGRPVKLIRPMLATLTPEMPTGPGWVFEETYDGIRALVNATRREWER